jgi:tetratricopeptide (TPR) repeat protein
MKELGQTNDLIKELDNNNRDIRIEVTKALGELKHITGLIEALKNDNFQVRVQAISELENIDDTEVILALVDVLTTDSIEAVWQRAFKALSKYGIDDERIWGNIAVELLKAKRYENAMSCFKKAVEINPNKETLGSIGATLIEHGIYKDALEYFERYVEIDPNDARGLAGKGAALFGLDRGEEAIGYCKRALEIDPEQKGAMNTLGAIYYNKGDHEALASLAWETLLYNPEDIKARLMMSEALAFSGKLTEAESEAQKALEFLRKREYIEAEDLSMLHQQLGMVAAMKGDKDTAIEQFQKAKSDSPGDKWFTELVDSYQILDILGLAMKGNTLERRGRILSLNEKRVRGQRGEGISDEEFIMIDTYKDAEEPMSYWMVRWTKDSWFYPPLQKFMLKFWPSHYFREAVEIASSKGIFEDFQKGLEEKILE